jgi:hypothetical protein
VLDPHGTVHELFGAPDIVNLIEGARELDFDLDPDQLVLCEIEAIADMRLARCLLRMQHFSPAYVAIVGYTFGRNGARYDDWISLEAFEHRFGEFDGDIYVIEPRPEATCEMLREGLP